MLSAFDYISHCAKKLSLICEENQQEWKKIHWNHRNLLITRHLYCSGHSIGGYEIHIFESKKSNAKNSDDERYLVWVTSAQGLLFIENRNKIYYVCFNGA